MKAVEIAEPNFQNIEMLMSLLERAESGELQAFCYAGILDDGSSNCGFSDADVGNKLALIGSMRVFEGKLVESLMIDYGDECDAEFIDDDDDDCEKQELL